MNVYDTPTLMAFEIFPLFALGSVMSSPLQATVSTSTYVTIATATLATQGIYILWVFTFSLEQHTIFFSVASMPCLRNFFV